MLCGICDRSAKCERSNPADNMVRKGGRGGAPGASTAIRAAAPGEAPSGAGGCGLKEAAAHGEPTQEQRIKGKLLPVGDLCWSSLLPMDVHSGMDLYWSRS